MQSIYHVHVTQEHLDAGQPVISGAPNAAARINTGDKIIGRAAYDALRAEGVPVAEVHAGIGETSVILESGERHTYYWCHDGIDLMAKCDRGLAAEIEPQFVTMMDLSHYTAYVAWQQERDTVGDAPMEWLASYSDRWLNSPGFCERPAAINQTSDNVGVVRLTLTPDSVAALQAAAEDGGAVTLRFGADGLIAAVVDSGADFNPYGGDFVPTPDFHRGYNRGCRDAAVDALKAIIPGTPFEELAAMVEKATRVVTEEWEWYQGESAPMSAIAFVAAHMALPDEEERPYAKKDGVT